MVCKDRVALVTGSSGGIGRSVALTLAREGAAVIVNYRTSQRDAQEIVDYINNSSGNAIAIQSDVHTEEGCRLLVNAAEKKYGRIDICVIGPGAGFNPQALDKLDPAEAISDVTKEVTPIFWLFHLVLPGMYKRKWGRIIGMAQHPTDVYKPAYSHNAAKASRSALLRLASEGETWSNGVTVNAISPSPVSTCKTLTEAIEQSNHGKLWTMRETTTGQDIAEAVVFLSSEAGKFITGCILPYAHRS